MKKKLFPAALAITAAIAIGVAIESIVELREVSRRLTKIEQINDKQTRALYILAGGLDDVNQQQQLRELYEQLKQNGPKGL